MATNTRSVTWDIGSDDSSRHRRIVDVAGGEGQHSQTTFGQLLVGRQDLVTDVAYGHLSVVPERPATTLDDNVGAPLTVTKCGPSNIPPAATLGGRGTSP